MKGTRLRRWTISLAIGCGLASVFSVQLAGPASGQYFQPGGANAFNNFNYGPSTFSGFGFPGFGGIFFPVGTQYLGTLTTVTTVGANPSTVTSQPVFAPVYSQPLYSQPAYAQPTYSGYSLPYPGYRGVYDTPGYATGLPYGQASSGPQQQEQQQQQAVPVAGVVVTQSQQQQQQGGGQQEQQQQQQQVS